MKINVYKGKRIFIKHKFDDSDKRLVTFGKGKGLFCLDKKQIKRKEKQ